MVKKMNYEKALDYINDKNKLGSRLGLESIAKLLSLLDNPQESLKFIHIGGTNGKGSTSSYLSYALNQAKYKVGLFTSPHLEKINESIKIDNEDISDESFARIVSLIEEKANIMVNEGFLHPTSFEIITAMAFIYFKEQNIDFCILEVGLGGRFDSTNIISKSLASVITTIDYDHIDILGDSLAQIAYQKAGIIKDNGIVISYPQEEEAMEIIKKISNEKNAELILCPMENIDLLELGQNGSKFNFRFNDIDIENISITMLGEYQIYNASLAITTLLTLRDKGFLNITREQIKEGFKNARCPGRLEILRKNPTFLIDGAHNVQGVNYLIKAIKLFEYNKLILGIGIFKDKDTSHMVKLLAPLAHKIIVTEANSPRKLDAEILAEEIVKYNKNIIIEKDINKAIDKSLEISEKDDIIIFGGSLYLIGEVRKIVKLL